MRPNLIFIYYSAKTIRRLRIPFTSQYYIGVNFDQWLYGFKSGPVAQLG